MGFELIKEPPSGLPSEEPPDSTWTCSSGWETFNGETRRGPSVYDAWFNQSGERVHAQYSSGLSLTDISIEYGAPVNGRVITSNESIYSYRGTLNGEPVDFSYMESKKKTTLSAKTAPNTFVDIEKGTPEYEDALLQLRLTNFDPPCQKPR